MNTIFNTRTRRSVAGTTLVAAVLLTFSLTSTSAKVTSRLLDVTSIQAAEADCTPRACDGDGAGCAVVFEGTVFVSSVCKQKTVPPSES